MAGFHRYHELHQQLKQVYQQRGELLKTLSRKHAISQTTIDYRLRATELEISWSTISKIFRGIYRHPSPEIIQAIATELHLDVDEQEQLECLQQRTLELKEALFQVPDEHEIMEEMLSLQEDHATLRDAYRRLWEAHRRLCHWVITHIKGQEGKR